MIALLKKKPTFLVILYNTIYISNCCKIQMIIFYRERNKGIAKRGIFHHNLARYWHGWGTGRNGTEKGTANRYRVVRGEITFGELSQGFFERNQILFQDVRYGGSERVTLRGPRIISNTCLAQI